MHHRHPLIHHKSAPSLPAYLKLISNKKQGGRTMAGGGGFLSSMFTTMVAKLHGLASPSTSSSSSSPHNNIEQEMRKLAKTMRRIQAKLADSEEEESHVKSHSEKLWLSELKDVAYDAEDVVDEYEYEMLRSKQLHSGTHEDELANKAAEIRKRFDEITKEWKLLKLPKKAGKRKRSPMLFDMNRETGSLVVESDVLGREEEKDMLIKWLLSENDTTGDGVSVIAVIGMGGLGKTTLAQLVYNDQRVKSYFDLTGWVCVSENFHVVSLTEKILQSFAKVKVHEELDELQRALLEKLQGKKFLLILDDVWNEEFTLWDELRKPLLSAHVGKVIVTTRNQPVAKIMGTGSPLNLNCLPFDVCWPLFKRVTLGGADKSLQPHLEDLGRKIVHKCKGLPLAVKVLGGALRNKEDIDSWEEVLENEMWESEERNNGVLPALKISYDCLPIQLKRCFQYLSIFPKDTDLYSEEIVRLWMSQGLLPLDEEDKRAEDIGRNYIKRLAERSIIQEWDDSFLIKGQFLSMHDLVHDLAQYTAQNEYLCVMDNKFDTKKLQKIRHLSFNVECHELNIEALRELKLLRTLFMRGLDWREYSWLTANSRLGQIGRVPDDLFQELKYIRTLVLGHNGIKELPYSLGNLKLLRYLSIRSSQIRSLPESICHLYNLQTLDMLFTQISELPKQIINLINLRHLLLSQGVFLPSGIGNMTNLQSLTCFDVSCEKEHCDIGELNSLMKLGGHISIFNAKYVNRFSNSKPPLKTNKYLDSLVLNWCIYTNYGKYEKKAEWQLEYLEPHVNLKILEIYNYPGVKFVGWVGASSFTKLTKLVLSDCNNCTKLPPLGQLPSLEEFKIYRMDGVQHVGREFCSMLMASPSSSQNKIAFPSLKRLIFRSMANWEAWDGMESEDFPNLHFIEISECSKLINFPKWPLLSSVKEMKLFDSALDATYWGSLTNLEIEGSGQEDSEWMSKSCFPMLQHLILKFEEVRSVRLSQERIPQLKTLEIKNCPALRVVAGLKNLTSLNSLIIEECPSLEFKGLPATLERVQLYSCRLFKKGYEEQQPMSNVLAHNSDDEEEEEEEMDVNDEEEEEMDGEDDDNNDDNMD